MKQQHHQPKDACPQCGGRYLKGIYFGLPLRICEDARCSCAQGLGVWAMEYIPITGPEGWAIFIYEGSYLRALWNWINN